MKTNNRHKITGKVKMNKKTSIIIAGIMLISVAVAITPTIKAQPPFHAVKGVLYIGEDYAEPGTEIKIAFDGEEFTGDTFELEYDAVLDLWFNYNVGVFEHEGETGDISVFYSSQYVIPTDNDTVDIHSGEPDFIYMDLHIDAGAPTNNPPYEPSDPSPVDGATDVGRNADLGWTGGDPDGDPVTYDVYFGIVSPPPQVATGQGETTYDPGEMTFSTTYYWQIVAWDDQGAHKDGPIWSFTTSAVNRPPNTPSTPSPLDDDTGIDISKVLSWTGGDPDGDPVTYDVYFGATNPPPKIEPGNQSGGTYAPLLAYSTKYYWKIIAWDNYGASTDSPIWSFTTKDKPSEPPPGPGPNPPLAPIADAGGPYEDFVGYEITFDGSGSTGAITSYEWNFGDGTTGSGETVTHSYDEPDTYVIILTVTGPGGSNTSTTNAVILPKLNNPPIAPEVTGEQDGTKNTDYNYTAMSTDDDNDTLQYTFDWGDDTNSTTDFVANGTAVTESHNWSTWGIYTISVNASDNKTYSGSTKYVVLIDVHWVKHIGYLIDTDSNGTYDSFYSNEILEQTSVEKLANGSYLINSDSDAEWDWIYDPDTDTLTAYSLGEDEPDNTIWYMLGLGIILAILLLLGIYYFTKKKPADKKPQQKKSTKKK